MGMPPDIPWKRTACLSVVESDGSATRLVGKMTRILETGTETNPCEDRVTTPLELSFLGMQPPGMATDQPPPGLLGLAETSSSGKVAAVPPAMAAPGLLGLAGMSSLGKVAAAPPAMAAAAMESWASAVDADTGAGAVGVPVGCGTTVSSSAGVARHQPGWPEQGLEARSYPLPADAVQEPRGGTADDVETERDDKATNLRIITAPVDTVVGEGGTGHGGVAASGGVSTSPPRASVDGGAVSSAKLAACTQPPPKTNQSPAEGEPLAAACDSMSLVQTMRVVHMQTGHGVHMQTGRGEYFGVGTCGGHAVELPLSADTGASTTHRGAPTKVVTGGRAVVSTQSQARCRGRPTLLPCSVTVLCCAVLCCTALWYAALCCAVLYCDVLCCATSRCAEWI